MAQIYTQDAAVVRCEMADDAPAGALEFDPTTNPDLARLLSQSVAGWTVADGKLERDGVAVVVNAPSAAYAERQAVADHIAADAATVAHALAVLETGHYPADDILIPALRALMRAVSH